jgi:Fur family peroxide stress response transcriptional regulator
VIDPDLITLKDVTAEIADETGFKIFAYRLDFFGICQECMNKKEDHTSEIDQTSQPN